MCRSIASIAVAISAPLIAIHVIVDASLAATRLVIFPLPLLLLIPFHVLLLLLLYSTENHFLISLSARSSVQLLSRWASLDRHSKRLQLTSDVADRQ
jgi:hypothetical protein